MPIIMKGNMEINKVEPKAPPKKAIWDNELRKFITIEDKPIEQPVVKKVKQKKVVERIEEPTPVVVDLPKYHEEHHGDLHKLYNTKSDYLSDMAALKD